MDHEKAGVIPPPPCPTNTVSNKHFRSDRIHFGS